MTAGWLTARPLTTLLHRMSMRTQLLVTVNAVLAGGLAVLLFVDYRNDVHQRVLERRSALEGEAIAMLASVRALPDREPSVLQAYLDDICAQMSEQSSPGHHIALRTGGLTLQAEAHHRASPMMLESMAAGANAVDGESVVAGRRMVVGHAGDGGLHVYVSEYVADIVAAVRGQVARRSFALASLGLLATLLVNLILLRTFSASVRRLVKIVREIGQGGVGLQAPSFRSSEFSFLASEISAMSRALAAAQHERTLQLARAKRIQAHLHPDQPKVAGLELSVLYQPATEIAGDFYDVLRLPDEAWLIAVGDVCGHGVPAAMGAAILKTLLAAAVESSSSLPHMLASINARFFSITLPEDFASLILVKGQPDRSMVEYASAGHETCFLARADGTAFTMKSTGMLLGVAPDVSWETASVQAHDGDSLVLITDGVTESMSPDGALFGRDILPRVVAAMTAPSPAAVTSRLSAALAEHRGQAPAHDDVTAIVARFTEKGSLLSTRPSPSMRGTVRETPR